MEQHTPQPLKDGLSPIMKKHLPPLFQIYRDLVRKAEKSGSLFSPFTCEWWRSPRHYNYDELETILSDLQALGIIEYRRYQDDGLDKWEVQILVL